MLKCLCSYKQMDIFTRREAVDPATDEGCSLSWPWAATEASTEHVTLNVLCRVRAGSEQPVLSVLSSWKSEFLGTCKLTEWREAR